LFGQVDDVPNRGVKYCTVLRNFKIKIKLESVRNWLMQIGIECNIKHFKHEILHLHVTWISEHFIQWNSFGIVEAPDDGCLRPKHVAKRRSKSGNSCIVDWIYYVWKLCKCNRMLKYNIYLHYLFAGISAYTRFFVEGSWHPFGTVSSENFGEWRRRT
jgi:hypothetical protein